MTFVDHRIRLSLLKARREVFAANEGRDARADAVERLRLEIIRQAADDADALTSLRCLQLARSVELDLRSSLTKIDAALNDLVLAARLSGYSWGEIGRAARPMSRQQAHRRWRGTIVS